jgi:hypothetical protein
MTLVSRGGDSHGASSTASAQVINNICWNVNGFAVKDR